VFCNFPTCTWESCQLG